MPTLQKNRHSSVTTINMVMQRNTTNKTGNAMFARRQYRQSSKRTWCMLYNGKRGVHAKISAWKLVSAPREAIELTICPIRIGGKVARRTTRTWLRTNPPAETLKNVRVGQHFSFRATHFLTFQFTVHL
jgi:hypothetical protein